MTEQQPKKRMHPWALGVTIVVIAFPLIFIGLAIWISSMDVPMVGENHYEQGTEYQQHIDARQRTLALDTPPTLTFSAGYRNCDLQFPRDAGPDDVTGSLHFYRVDDDRRDISVPIRLDTTGRQLVPMDQLEIGQWIVKLRWISEGAEYYLEERIYKR